MIKDCFLGIFLIFLIFVQVPDVPDLPPQTRGATAVCIPEILSSVKLPDPGNISSFSPFVFQEQEENQGDLFDINGP